MATKRNTTTIKVSRRVMRHIDTNSSQDESVDETLRRLLGLASGETRPPEVPPPTTTIKVSDIVMKHIKVHCKGKESRDQTLSRLLKIDQDGGNVGEDFAASTKGVTKILKSAERVAGNVRTKR